MEAAHRSGPSPVIGCASANASGAPFIWFCMINSDGRQPREPIREWGEWGTACAGINRHVVGDERALQEREMGDEMGDSLRACRR